MAFGRGGELLRVQSPELVKQIVEGGREQIADARVQAFTERLEALDHAGDIRVPIAFLPRLYPRARKGGRPDLIESAVRSCSGAYGEPALFDLLPSAVFTPAG